MRFTHFVTTIPNNPGYNTFRTLQSITGLYPVVTMRLQVGQTVVTKPLSYIFLIIAVRLVIVQVLNKLWEEGKHPVYMDLKI